MTSLRILQTCFQDYLMQGTSAMQQYVTPDPLLSAEKRLRVYFDAYRIRLFEILKLDFEKTHTLMGDENFEKAFVDYLNTYPSEHFSVRYFGQRFPKFLKESALFSDFPIFAEMAQFEWCVAYTLDAKDAPVLEQNALKAIPLEAWPTLQFAFHPSVISHVFEWNVPLLWKCIEQDMPPQPPEKFAHPIRCIFWRNGIRSFYQSCERAHEALLYTEIIAEHDFATISESLLDVLPEDTIALTLAQTINQWVQEGRFTLIL